MNVNSERTSAAHGAAKALPPAPRLEFCFEARISLETVYVIGSSVRGLRRVIPFKGGIASGPRFEGVVLPGGADWQIIRPDEVIEIEARLTLQAHDGVQIMATSHGVRHGPAEVLARLARGESVRRDEYYFRATACFEAPRESAYDWMNRTVFVCDGAREHGAAVVRYYAVE